MILRYADALIRSNDDLYLVSKGGDNTRWKDGDHDHRTTHQQLELHEWYVIDLCRFHLFANFCHQGMVTSWNKLCFTTGYLEVSLSLPGTSQSPGFWPGECLCYLCIPLAPYQ